MKIGILGGTFDPAHLGHIELARKAKIQLKLDKIIFIPSYIPPHKDNEEILPWKDRYEMASLACKGSPGFAVSDIEFRLKGTSYTINTIKELKRMFQDAEIFFIAGSDYLKELASWKDIDELEKICTFVIARRAGFAMERPPAHIRILDAEFPDISSTEIRRRAREGEPFKEFVPKEVYNYIITKELYR